MSHRRPLMGIISKYIDPHHSGNRALDDSGFDRTARGLGRRLGSVNHDYGNTAWLVGKKGVVHRNHAFRRWGVCLPHVVGDEGAVETGGRLGELGGRQLEKTGGGLDEPGRNVAAAAGAAHVVEGLADCVHVKAFDSEIPIAFFHGIGMSDYTRAPEGCG